MANSRPSWSREFSFDLALARRYLKSTRKESHSRLLSLLASMGMGLGVAALVISLAALSGFQELLKKEVLDRTPALRLHPLEGTSADEIRQELESYPGVLGVQVELSGSGWIRLGPTVRPVQWIGFEDRVPTQFPGAQGGPPGLYLGSRIVRYWSLEPGTTVELVSSLPTLTPLGPQPRVRRLPFAGQFDSGVVSTQDYVALPLTEAKRLSGSGNLYLAAEVSSLDLALNLAAELKEAFAGRAEVTSWKDLNEGLFFALRLEKTMTFLAVALVVLVGALALVTSLAFVVSNKRAEIGMLATLGLSSRRIRRVFILLGALLAVRASILGAVVGATLGLVLDATRAIPIPGNAFFVEYVPFSVHWLDVVVVLLATVAMALACTLQASGRAAQLDPVEALRR